MKELKFITVFLTEILTEKLKMFYHSESVWGDDSDSFCIKFYFLSMSLYIVCGSYKQKKAVFFNAFF
jgi:hypothetical protein